MKLRNKKTGLTGKLINIYLGIYEDNIEIDISILLDNSGGECMDKQFNSIDELKKFFEDWEDYKSAEPLIKDEKIRKAVRAWAEANKEEELEVMGGCSVTAFKSLYNHTEIDFNCSWKLRDSVYTIEELCGEEK